MTDSRVLKSIWSIAKFAHHVQLFTHFWIKYFEKSSQWKVTKCEWSCVKLDCSKKWSSSKVGGLEKQTRPIQTMNIFVHERILWCLSPHIVLNRLLQFFKFIEKLNQNPLLKSQKLTLCNASRVGNIQHEENKISQHLKKSLLYPENKFEIFFWQKCQNLSMQRMLIRLDHWDEPLNTRTVH